MSKNKFMRKTKSMYTNENSFRDEEDNDDSTIDVLSMDFIQDENMTRGKLTTIGASTSSSKDAKEWTYNGIFFPLQNTMKRINHEPQQNYSSWIKLLKTKNFTNEFT